MWTKTSVYSNYNVSYAGNISTILLTPDGEDGIYLINLWVCLRRISNGADLQHVGWLMWPLSCIKHISQSKSIQRTGGEWWESDQMVRFIVDRTNNRVRPYTPSYVVTAASGRGPHQPYRIFLVSFNPAQPPPPQPLARARHKHISSNPSMSMRSIKLREQA